MAQPKSRPEVLTGLFVLVGLGCLATLILQYGRFTGKVGDYYEFDVTFDSAAGVVDGSLVTLGGTPVGKVAATPQLIESFDARVVLRIREDISIPKNAKFSIGSDGLLGDKIIEISPPSGEFSSSIAPGDSVAGSSSKGLDQLQSDVGEVLDKTVVALESFNETASNLDSTLLTVNETVSVLRSGFLSEGNAKNLTDLIGNLNTFSSDLATLGPKLEPTLEDFRITLASFNQTATNADKTLAEAKQQLSSLEPAIAEITPAVRALSETSQKASKAIDKLDNDDGLLNTLTTDEKVATDTKDFVKNLKRYGILRYRDAETDPTPDPRDRFRGSRR